VWPSVALVPFLSQQDKVTGEFLLSTDSGLRLYTFLGLALQERGWHVQMHLPPYVQCEKYSLKLPTHHTDHAWPVSNLERRLDWHISHLKELVCDDLVLTQHETLAVPLSVLGAKVVTEFGMKPGTAWPETEPLHTLARKASALVHCNSEELARYATRVEGCCSAKVWCFGYDKREFVGGGYDAPRLSVLFNARSSSTNYSNHRVFVEAVKRRTDARMVDPTGYLAKSNEGVGVLPRMKRSEYLRVLHESRVVVSLVDNGYGGYAFYEALAAGCCPVTLDTPAYREVLTDCWPYFTSLNPLEVEAHVDRAMRWGWANVPYDVRAEVARCLAGRSYQAATEQAILDLEELLC
jgi:hypothetical protein